MDIIVSIRKTMAKNNLVKFLFIFWSLILGIKETNAKEDIIYNIHKKNFSFESIDGGRLNLSDFEGKVILISNTASFCGFTNQYKALQEVYESYLLPMQKEEMPDELFRYLQLVITNYRLAIATLENFVIE